VNDDLDDLAKEGLVFTATGRRVHVADYFKCLCGSLNVRLVDKVGNGLAECATLVCNDCERQWTMLWSPWYDYAWDVFKKSTFQGKRR